MDGWSIGLLVGWTDELLVSSLVRWVVGWTDDGWMGRLVGWLVDWLNG